MKQFFYRTKAMILIFVMVSMLLSLSAIAIEKREMGRQAYPYLSEESAVGSMNQNEKFEPILTKKVFTDNIKNISNDYYFSAELEGINSFAVFYSKDVTPKIKIEKGRLFSEMDFAEERNVAIASAETLKDCVLKGDTYYYYYYEGKAYKIIGIYENVDAFGNNNPKVILNYLAKNLGSQILNCNFTYDSLNNTMKNAEKLKGMVAEEYEGAYIECVSISDKTSDQYLKDGSNIKGMILLVIGLAILVLLNAISTCQYWLEGKKKEISVRKMVGADRNRIVAWLIISFGIIVTLSYAFGIVLVKCFLLITPYLPVATSTLQMFGKTIVWSAMIKGYLVIFVLGIIILTINLCKYNKTEIARNFR